MIKRRVRGNMKIYYKVMENLLIRPEVFGGVIINKANMQRLELRKEEAVYLCALNKFGGDAELSDRAVKILTGNNVDEKRLLEYGIIQTSEQTDNVEVDYSEIVRDIEEEFCHVWKFSQMHLSAPLEITIYPTLNCNLNCKFCFVKNKNEDVEEIDAEVWLKTLKEAKEMKVLSLSILGGEPTRYRYIDELLKGINELELKTTITSNGIGIKDSTKQMILDCKYIIPVFSVQSFSEKNKDLMGVGYERILETIEYMLEKGKEVRLNSVYTNQDIEEIFEIIDFCINKGISRYSIGVYVDINDSNEQVKRNGFYEVRLLDEKLQAYIVNKYGEGKLDLSVEGCLLYTGYPELEHDIQEISEFEKEYFGCRAGKSKLEIYPNGDVYPCICFENLLIPTSNITNSSLRDIWDNDEAINELRAAKTLNDECQKCGYNIICNSGCPAIKMKQFGTDFMKYKDPRCAIQHDN
jgi:KxxxW cyclic peptide radical SAM maturase